MGHENERYKVVRFDLAIGRMWYVVDKRLNLAVKMTTDMTEAMNEFERLSKAKLAA